jgi:hypothetical protein
MFLRFKCLCGPAAINDSNEILARISVRRHNFGQPAANSIQRWRDALMRLVVQIEATFITREALIQFEF